MDLLIVTGNQRRLMINWTKCPSVTYGGKPYFWTAEISQVRYWIIWNRHTLVWDIICRESNKLTDTIVAEDVKSPEKAMKWMEDKLNETP
jgi:hypothetical protein